MTMYLEPMNGGIWAVSRFIENRSVYLVQGRPVDQKGDAHAVLRALRISPTKENLDLYFPEKLFGGRGNIRCPTLELMELCNALDPTIRIEKKQPGV